MRGPFDARLQRALEASECLRQAGSGEHECESVKLCWSLLASSRPAWYLSFVAVGDISPLHLQFEVIFFSRT